MTDSPRRVTELPLLFPDVRVCCGSRTVEDREEPGSWPCDRETRASFDRLPALLPRETTPLALPFPELRWLG